MHSLVLVLLKRKVFWVLFSCSFDHFQVAVVQFNGGAKFSDVRARAKDAARGRATIPAD